MRFTTLLLILTFQLFAQEQLTFQNGDSWQGQLHEISDGRIKLKSGLTETPLLLSSKHLKKITLNQSIHQTGKFNIHFTNGDGITADIIELNKEFLKVKSSIAGELQIPRKFLRGIFPANQRTVEQEIKEWDGQISDDGTIKGRVTKKLSLKNAFVMNVDLEFKTIDPGFYIMFYNNSTFSSNQRYYSYMSVTRKAQGKYTVEGHLINGSSRILAGSLDIPKDTKKMKLEMYLNPKNGLTVFTINGKKLGEEKTDFAIDTNNMNIRLQGYSNVQLKSFKIEKWNGKHILSAREGGMESDTMFLTNQDEATCKIESIKNNKVTISSHIGNPSVPMDLVASLSFANPSVERSTDETSIVMKNGLIISGQLISCEEKSMRLKSPIFGEKLLKREYVSSMRWSKTYKPHENMARLTLEKMTINGLIISLNDKEVKVKSENLFEETSFPRKDLKSIKLANVNQSKAQWNVELTNGDNLSANIEKFENDQLTFKSGNETLLIKKENIVSLHNLNHIKKFSSSSRINFNTEIALPRRSQIQFRLTNDVDNNGIYLRLFGAKRGHQSYNLRLRHSPSLQYSRPITPKNYNVLLLKPGNLITIKVDKDKALMELWENDRLALSYTDPKGYQGKGDVFYLYTYNSGTINDLYFRTWNDGNVKRPYTITENWDKKEGEIKSIDSEKAVIGDKTITLTELREISFNPPGKKGKSKITAKTSGDGLLHLQSMNISDSKIIIEHENVGKLTLPLNYFKEVNFN